jgi:hypothetical protein
LITLAPDGGPLNQVQKFTDMARCILILGYNKTLRVAVFSRANEDGQLSQPMQACNLWLWDLPKMIALKNQDHNQVHAGPILPPT